MIEKPSCLRGYPRIRATITTRYFIISLFCISSTNQSSLFFDLRVRFPIGVPNEYSSSQYSIEDRYYQSDDPTTSKPSWEWSRRGVLTAQIKPVNSVACCISNCRNLSCFTYFKMGLWDNQTFLDCYRCLSTL